MNNFDNEKLDKIFYEIIRNSSLNRSFARLEAFDEIYNFLLKFDNSVTFSDFKKYISNLSQNSVHNKNNEVSLGDNVLESLSGGKNIFSKVISSAILSGLILSSSVLPGAFADYSQIGSSEENEVSSSAMKEDEKIENKIGTGAKISELKSKLIKWLKENPKKRRNIILCGSILALGTIILIIRIIKKNCNNGGDHGNGGVGAVNRGLSSSTEGFRARDCEEDKISAGRQISRIEGDKVELLKSDSQEFSPEELGDFVLPNDDN
ncbi:MAG: hypothetical protein LBK29_03875 [Oscillospiraceae bacterium]|nr:hypothetical protein [Oscillospiraceae bacterium]